ncbi:hypothetical protein BJ508DRAFT_418788 [Ascobolus immersus RN42]|uniref:Alpha/beta hydrolase fold-3 domain-containing protein n=1 Tax=Ascobolus immersus RN42 TaxID=1160509 RepID=A0A3N4HJD6_ASCIM|nr:hypothetical protein BJ508DRAFT_418788 [Ascobolus immersus RN42]
MARPRWLLTAEANMWRFLMSIGMLLHTVAPPRPMSPSFTRTIPSTISPHKGSINLVFYTPANYTTTPAEPYPVLVNFHGGGFTIGTATDDSRWATKVVDEVGAVVVSVDYRRAPEFAFPTAVEDGVDAVLWLIHHAQELGIDAERIAVSGFSAGGNMAFTVPLRLEAELRKIEDSEVTVVKSSGTDAKNEMDGWSGGAARGGQTVIKTGSKVGKICAIIAWYPSTDFTISRPERRATNVDVSKELPKFFTDLFDASYLYPPKTLDVRSPYLSPGVADSEFLQRALPDEGVWVFTVEYDELRDEAERFVKRLRGLGKNVRGEMIRGVPHGWDKSVNPLKWDGDGEIRRVYQVGCEGLKEAFGRRG